MPQTPHPCLPPDLIFQFKSDPETKSSDIFTNLEFDSLRLAVLQRSYSSNHDEQRVPLETEVANERKRTHFASRKSTEFRPSVWRNLDNFETGAGKTFLQGAIRWGDEPLVYELIRMGTTIDFRDSDGVTPLFFTLEHIFATCQLRRDEFSARRPSSVKSGPMTGHQKTIDRTVRIAKLLIEQHADVNADAFGYTPLCLAADSHQWDLVKLLLLHGARPLGPHDDQPRSTADRIRLASLMKETKAAIPRPARHCPCWSGKPLSECHDASPQPYPNHFLCGCGKRRTFDMCCGKRGIIIEERWNAELQCIKAHPKMRLLAPHNVSPDVKPVMDEKLKDATNLIQELMADPQLKKDAQPFIDHIMQDKAGIIMRNLRKLGRDSEMEPAYLFALGQASFVPRPWEGTLSKVECHSRMQEWNELVDRYIATMPDPRKHLDIELQSKIGPHGGPLYRVCEAKGCKNVEGRDLERIQGCSGCQLVFYCSKECQKSDWKEHKAECKTKTHRPQQLHSQWLVDHSVSGLWTGKTQGS